MKLLVCSDIIKRLLSNLGTIGNGLAELLGVYGTGHGKHGKTSALSARHAKLCRRDIRDISF
jgi:hypothetical protein